MKTFRGAGRRLRATDPSGAPHRLVRNATQAGRQALTGLYRSLSGTDAAVHRQLGFVSQVEAVQELARGLIHRALTPEELGVHLEALKNGAPLQAASEGVTVQGSSLPDLRTLYPDRYRSDGDSLCFVADDEEGFRLLEDAIRRFGYYEQPGVWSNDIDIDKRLTTALALGLGAGRVLEIGCWNGSVVKLLADAGADPVGLDISHLAFVLADADVRYRMVWGDLLTTPLEGPFDVMVAMDVYEHLNPTRLHEYFARSASLLAPEGALVINSPIFGEDDMWGQVFEPYVQKWNEEGDDTYWSWLHCDERGWPLHGHLVWASTVWWETALRQAGLVRDRELERVALDLLAPYHRHAPARRSMYILRPEGARLGDPGLIRGVRERLGADPDLQRLQREVES